VPVVEQENMGNTPLYFYNSQKGIDAIHFNSGILAGKFTVLATQTDSQGNNIASLVQGIN